MKTVFLLLVMVLVGVAGVAAGVFGQPYLSKAGILGPADSHQEKEDTTSRTQDTVSALGRLEPESEIVKVSAPSDVARMNAISSASAPIAAAVSARTSSLRASTSSMPLQPIVICASIAATIASRAGNVSGPTAA